MPNTVSFFVPGEARGKARPRTVRTYDENKDGILLEFGVRSKPKVHTYTPDPGGWVESVTAAATAERRDPALAEYTGAVEMFIKVARAMPKSWSKKKRATNGQPCLSTPDSVNVAAAVMDALNHVLYKDDKQVYFLSVTQEWAEEHGTRITLRYEEEGS